jgi:hypothetical protein
MEHIFIFRGNTLAIVRYPTDTHPGDVLSSHHFFCPTCGQIWGQILNPSGEGNHLAEEYPCDIHGGGDFYTAFATPWLRIGWSPSKNPIIRYLPRAVLAHDLLILTQEAA